MKRNIFIILLGLIFIAFGVSAIKAYEKFGSDVTNYNASSNLSTLDGKVLDISENTIVDEEPLITAARKTTVKKKTTAKTKERK